MKIGIITFSRAKNFGAVLQAYALCSFLEKEGHDVRLIDYITERCAASHPDFVEKRTNNSRFWKKNKLLKALWKKLYLQKEIDAHEHFFRFLQGRIQMTDCFYNNEELKENCPQFDIYMTGSDQVWNTDFTWNHKIDLPYFLDFVPDEKRRISYASSFGRDSLREETVKDIYTHLKRYHAISVREDSAKKLIETMGLAAENVIDPTFLCDTKDWISLCRPLKCNKDFLLIFLIQPNKNLVKIAHKIADEKKMDLVVIVSSRINQKKLLCGAIIPEVDEWISYFKDASFVITDSFHATAFSIQFHKPFIVDATAQYNTRISSILSQLSLEQRSLKEWDRVGAEELFNTPIDYETVESFLTELKADSKNWIRNYLEGCSI